MNRFLTFFLVSFILHMAVGAVLLSRTGILGSGGTAEVELNTLETLPEETGEANTKEVEKREVSKPEKLKPRPKVKKKVVKKKKPKPKVAQPVKKSEPVKEAEVVEEKSSPSPVTSADDKVGKGDKADDTKPVGTQQPKEVKTPEAEEKPSDVSPEAQPPKEEWVDEEEMIEEKEQEKAEQAPLSPEPKEDASDEKKPAPPQNEQESSSTKSSGSMNQDIPSLKGGSVRNHSQLRQIGGNPMPVYPKEALRKKWEGRAEVLYYVNPAGFVEKIHLKKSSGHSILDNAALRALARYRYYPGQEGWVRHPVEFVLDFEKEVRETAPLGVRGSASQK